MQLILVNSFRQVSTPLTNISPTQSPDSIASRSETRVYPSVPKRHVSLFKSWSKGVVTQIIPPLGQKCSKLMAGDSTELKTIVHLLKRTNSSSAFALLTNCRQIMHEFHDNFYVSQQERSFPIAFALIVYTNAQQILRFLKVIYRPQNIYCIHPDPKSGENFTRLFRHLSHCLSNVFIPSRVHEVKYNSNSSIFKAQMSCFRDLEAYPYKKWHYVINLCGRELPLKTNRYIVESLKLMNTTSVVKPQLLDTYTLETRFFEVKRRIWSQQNCSNCTPSSGHFSIDFMQRNEEFLKHYGIKLYKSMAYNALSRSFIHHILHNQKMQLFTKWMLKNCQTPEEHFYATAYMMPKAPGGFYSLKSSLAENIPQVSKAIWKHKKTSNYYASGEECSGKSVHQVCILTSAELPQIKRVMKWNTWFFNKYFMEDDHVVMDCVEEQLIKANRQEFMHDQSPSHRSCYYNTT